MDNYVLTTQQNLSFLGMILRSRNWQNWELEHYVRTLLLLIDIKLIKNVNSASFFKTEGHQRTPYAFLVFFKLVFLCPPVSSIYSTGVTVKCNCLCFYGIYTCAIHELPRKILQVSNAQCLKMTEMSKKNFVVVF